jgi:hypothetical protein
LPERCPGCGGEVIEDHLAQQFQTEIPRKPIVREFKIHCGHCKKCGQSLRGRHPLQTSDATGAAQSQLGSDAQSAIVYFNKRTGMSYGKIADTFDHALRRARTLLDKQTGAAKLFPQQVIDLLVGALRLRDRLNDEKAEEERRGRAYEDYVQRLHDLTVRPHPNPENARFARHLNKHAASWFLFFVDPNIRPRIIGPNRR